MFCVRVLFSVEFLPFMVNRLLILRLTSICAYLFRQEFARESRWTVAGASVIMFSEKKQK